MPCTIHQVWDLYKSLLKEVIVKELGTIGSYLSKWSCFLSYPPLVYTPQQHSKCWKAVWIYWKCWKYWKDSTSMQSLKFCLPTLFLWNRVNSHLKAIFHYINTISHLLAWCSSAGETGTGTALVTFLATNKTARISLLTSVVLKSAAVAFVTVKPSYKTSNMTYNLEKVQYYHSEAEF